MHSCLEILFNRIVGKKYSTEGFFDDDGNFLQRDVILEIVFSVLPQEKVAAVYLIGSVLCLRGKKYVYLQPRDIDVFVQVNCQNLGELYYCRQKFGDNTLSINGGTYPIHWIVYDCGPFEVYEKYGELKLCFSNYRLYP